jgi:hypothetical protein
MEFLRALRLGLSAVVSFAAIAVAAPTFADLLSAQAANVAVRTSDSPDSRLDSGHANARIVFVSGVVDSVDKDFFGRTKKVAIVTISDSGALLQNPIEDSSAGEELKHHVGEDVTARGVVLVKADGSMSLLVDAFQVHGGKGGFVGDRSKREY